MGWTGGTEGNIRAILSIVFLVRERIRFLTWQSSFFVVEGQHLVDQCPWKVLQNAEGGFSLSPDLATNLQNTLVWKNEMVLVMEIKNDFRGDYTSYYSFILNEEIQGLEDDGI